MHLSEAIEMIRDVRLDGSRPHLWADLGCGSGLFSRALASLLPTGSRVLCCDKLPQKFEGPLFSGTGLEFVQLDFEKESLINVQLDGILMANSLHYVRDQHPFIKKWSSLLKLNGTFLIVEYDTERSNQWVPYPVSFSKLRSLFHDVSPGNFKKLNERGSVYRPENIYSCEIKM